MVGAGEALDCFEADLDEGGYHDYGEDEDAEGFETGATDGVEVFVAAFD